ncbi:MAG: hypothetical protein F4103_03190, partial [Boseongicola sp. SB0673_bin_14]|nr:hypothetical protein [Boseongicola sp. SB0673_bin_14]
MAEDHAGGAARDAGATRDGAIDLGDLSGLEAAQFPRGTVDGIDDVVDWYRFELAEARDVEFGLRRQEADADLHLEDASGTVLQSSALPGTVNESVLARLEAGTYYVRVEAREAGTNGYVLRYGPPSGEPGSTRASARDLGDLGGAGSVTGKVGVHGDMIDYWRFELSEAREVTFALADQDADADLFLEDASGTVLRSGAAPGTATEEVTALLEAGTYFVRIEAREGGANAHALRWTAREPDTAPEFAEASYAFGLAENADGSADRVSLGTVSASDADGDALSYSIVAGNGAGLFAIDSSTGEIFYTGPGEGFEIDADPRQLTVRASDGTNVAEAVVTVSVADVDEAGASRQEAMGLGDLTRATAVRSMTQEVGRAGDAADWYRFELTEERELQLGLRTGAPGAVTVALEDSSGTWLGGGAEYRPGHQAVVRTLEAGTHYLRVEASGEGAAGYEMWFRTGLPDGVHETRWAGTLGVPAFADARYTFDLPEHADGSAERVPLGTVSASDPGDEALSYSLVAGNDAGLFAIDAATGELHYTGSGEDFEAGAGPFGLTVRVTDGTHTVDADVTVTVTDVDETPAFAEEAYAFDLAENVDGSGDRILLGTVAASVTGGGGLTYSLVSGNEAGLFAIDAATGELFYTGAGEDHESVAGPFGLTVRASDGTNGAETSVTVTVTDVAEAPSFAEEAYAFTVAENADGSTSRVSLGKVAANDPDGGGLGYSLVPGADAGLFHVTSSTGELFYFGTGE